MDILGTRIHCPYWMNKIVLGKVVLRGYLNGKGTASDIRQELIRRLQRLTPESKFELNPENLKKMARRERIGIDCSGFAYRVLERLLELRKKKIKLDTVFADGIERTNARTLTGLEYCLPVKSVANLAVGDMIRLWGGRHLAVIVQSDAKSITYAHSSNLSTKIWGVHQSIIRIIDKNRGLEKQDWIEKDRKDGDFGKKYFRPGEGDGAFRLKEFK